LEKITKWRFHTTSNEVIWPKKIQISSTGKKCHFGNFSEWAGMAMPCKVGPQESPTGIEKLFLSWVLVNIKKDWKAKLESAYSFMLKYYKITV
jgi:hypothetical protein